MGKRTKCAAAATLALVLVAASGCGSGDGGGTSAEPTAGEWKTWVLPSGAAVAVPPPPAAGSRAADRDQRELSAMVEARTPAEEKRVSRWDSTPVTAPWMQDAMDYVSQRPKDPPYSSRAYALVAVAM